MDKIIEEMHPKQRDGLEINGEAVGDMPAAAPTTSQLIGHMGAPEDSSRRPKIRFVAEDDPSEIWSLGDDRVVAGADVTVTPELFRGMQEGFYCMRCHEGPQEMSFPLACDLCGYSMKELQIRDLALEFDGYKHLGPSKPINEFMDQAEEEYLKQKFAEKIAAGKSPMTGLKHSAS